MYSLADPALDDMWAGLDVASLEPDGTVAECAETSSVAEISSHVCESFFLSPERTLDCEQPVRRVFQSLGLAVDGLLEMVLDSARQVRRHGLQLPLQRRVLGGVRDGRAVRPQGPAQTPGACRRCAVSILFSSRCAGGCRPDPVTGSHIQPRAFLKQKSSLSRNP